MVRSGSGRTGCRLRNRARCARRPVARRDRGKPGTRYRHAFGRQLCRAVSGYAGRGEDACLADRPFRRTGPATGRGRWRLDAGLHARPPYARNRAGQRHRRCDPRRPQPAVFRRHSGKPAGGGPGDHCRCSDGRARPRCRDAAPRRAGEPRAGASRKRARAARRGAGDGRAQDHRADERRPGKPRAGGAPVRKRPLATGQRQARSCADAALSRRQRPFEGADRQQCTAPPRWAGGDLLRHDPRPAFRAGGRADRHREYHRPSSRHGGGCGRGPAAGALGSSGGPMRPPCGAGPAVQRRGR